MKKEAFLTTDCLRKLFNKINIYYMPLQWKHDPDLKASILRTRGARGISMNNELAKNATRLLASRFVGTSLADSLTVRRR